MHNYSIGWVGFKNVFFGQEIEQKKIFILCFREEKTDSSNLLTGDVCI
jgi:hypothetical protein